MWRLFGSLSIKNLRQKPFRSGLLTLLITFLSASLFGGVTVVKSLRQGLSSYEDRLGADVIVVPYEASTKSSIDDILLTGIAGNYYLNSSYLSAVRKVEGVEAASGQFYLTSAKASCCSSRVQIIGFDPESDFTIKPWIEKSYGKDISYGDIVVGNNLNIPSSHKIRFYGENYGVVAQLAKTGTGLDSAVYADISTVKHMAETSNALTYNEELASVDVEKSMSAIFVKVKGGYTNEEVAARINSSLHGVKVQSSASMVSNISSGLEGVSIVITVMLGVLYLLSAIILATAFSLIGLERKKEFAILRTFGASRFMLAGVLCFESMLLTGVSSLLGIAIASIALIPLNGALPNLLSLPFLMPSVGEIALYALLTFAITLLVSFLTSIKSAHDVSKDDAALLLREDA